MSACCPLGSPVGQRSMLVRSLFEPKGSQATAPREGSKLTDHGDNRSKTGTTHKHAESHDTPATQPNQHTQKSQSDRAQTSEDPLIGPHCFLSGHLRDYNPYCGIVVCSSCNSGVLVKKICTSSRNTKKSNPQVKKTRSSKRGNSV